MDFCDYKNSLGEPKKGMHSQRFLGIALVDFLGTIGIGIILAVISGLILSNAMKLNMSMWNTVVYWLTLCILWIILAFLFGILMHWLFCVETELNKFLYLA